MLQPMKRYCLKVATTFWGERLSEVPFLYLTLRVKSVLEGGEP